VSRTDGTTAILTFAYDGTGIGDGLLFERIPYEAPGEIGLLELYVKASGIENYTGDPVEIPIVAETAPDWRIPYGARLFRELSDKRSGMDGATVDFAHDIIPSLYYPSSLDFYDLKSGGSLDILNRFRTIQQASGYTCGLTSALMTLDWYDMRAGTHNSAPYVLNEQDLSKLRGPNREYGGATTQRELINVFDRLETDYGQEWDYVSGYDLKATDAAIVYENYYSDDPTAADLDVEFNGGGNMKLFDAIPWYVKHGVPVILGSQEWHGHYQVAVGYDDRGTSLTADDVLILTDPYDTTDQRQDGFVVQSYERFIWDWSVEFDKDFTNFVFLAAWPENYTYDGSGAQGSVIADDTANGANYNNGDAQLIKRLYGANADTAYLDKLGRQLLEMNETSPYSPDYPIWFDGQTQLSGPANADVYRSGDVPNSPYYKHIDFYDTTVTAKLESLDILPKFETIQQATEFTCGPTSMLMVLNHFGDRGDLTEIDLAKLRDKTDNLPGSTVGEMLNIVKNLNKAAGAKVWETLSTYDVNYGNYGGTVEHKGKSYDIYGDMIPHFIAEGIPVMIMWHEWGGHWQVIIGYDDMGTPDETADDVIVLADPYDTTDHNQNGYVTESFERLVFDWGNGYDEDVEADAFVVLYPVAKPSGSGSGGSPGGSGGVTSPSTTPDTPEPSKAADTSAAPQTGFAAFTDAASHWAADSIRFVVENKYMNGVSATSFAPEQTASRAMFIAILGRLDGIADANTASAAGTAFQDVPANLYYASHVEWGIKNNIVNGLSESVFGPNAPVTREQAAVFAARYLKYKGVDLSGADATFPDRESVSDWAREDIAALYALGILKGREDGSFDGKATITRAEMTVILQNLILYLQERAEAA
jgi:hypothetical protein